MTRVRSAAGVKYGARAVDQNRRQAEQFAGIRDAARPRPGQKRPEQVATRVRHRPCGRHDDLSRRQNRGARGSDIGAMELVGTAGPKFSNRPARFSVPYRGRELRDRRARRRPTTALCKRNGAPKRPIPHPFAILIRQPRRAAGARFPARPRPSEPGSARRASPRRAAAWTLRRRCRPG